MTERRGRKRKHPNPLSDIDAMAAMRVLNEVRVRENWSEAEAKRRFEDVVNQDRIVALGDDELENAEFDIDPATFKKIVNNDIRINDSHKWGIFLWMREYFSNELEAKKLEELLRQKEKLLHAFNQLLGFDELNHQIAQALVGSYDLYRPLYSNPYEEILIQRLVIGSEKSVFDCKLFGEHKTKTGAIEQDQFEGKIVPQGDRVAAVLRVPRNFKGSMIAHFDDLDTIRGGGEVRSMSGLVLTAIGNRRASAWPIFASRVEPNSPLEKSVIGRSAAHELPRQVIEALDRGAVHWSSTYYPRTFSR